jgi:hypothetical protein
MSGLGAVLFAVVMVVFSLVITVVSVAVPLAITGGVFYVIMKGAQKNRELLSKGTPAVARIMSVRETGTYINNQPQLAFALQVTCDGQSWDAIVNRVTSIVEIPRLQPGAEVMVRFNPQNRMEMAIDM